jgi:hypothetical protein
MSHFPGTDRYASPDFAWDRTLLGAVGPARAEVICYEPSWHHGNAVVAWPVEPIA